MIVRNCISSCLLFTSIVLGNVHSSGAIGNVLSIDQGCKLHVVPFLNRESPRETKNDPIYFNISLIASNSSVNAILKEKRVANTLILDFQNESGLTSCFHPCIFFYANSDVA